MKKVSPGNDERNRIDDCNENVIRRSVRLPNPPLLYPGYSTPPRNSERFKYTKCIMYASLEGK